ncbi:MAG: Hypothetical protein BHV28_15230 [Candidatus Tokpelaia hoelldobleri]|uniref:Uncharacterized protein n=1 Tax=Candidatus Tokpelaia hoelldobleri TaxID=1902579 RepID=A0A1U9JWH6_9HYPH|nr:MAG: Hypothetical protein BHV28_15230 [Candidatus Tokpelaia hoelldoblerii]
MSGLFALMVLVSCSDGLQECRLADEALHAYTMPQQCEQVLMPTMRTLSVRGEQIFGRCLMTDGAALTKNSVLYWRIDQRGDFYTEIREKRKVPAVPKPFAPQKQNPPPVFAQLALPEGRDG